MWFWLTWWSFDYFQSNGVYSDNGLTHQIVVLMIWVRLPLDTLKYISIVQWIRTSHYGWLDRGSNPLRNTTRSCGENGRNAMDLKSITDWWSHYEFESHQDYFLKCSVGGKVYTAALDTASKEWEFESLTEYFYVFLLKHFW
jgi:hypothetical protein